LLFQQLEAEQLAAAKDDFMKTEAKGIIRRSSSSLGNISPTGEEAVRVQGALLKLLAALRHDCSGHQPSAQHNGLFCKGHWMQKILKIDLRKGYYQIFMHPDDIPKTAIITPFGLFEFLHLPFGLRNAGSTFQRMMDQVLVGLLFIFVYLDDIIVASKSLEQHQKDVEDVLCRLWSAGLVINEEKCKFAVPEVLFLAHHVTAEGIKPLPDRVAAI
jgi:hypothetical protein